MEDLERELRGINSSGTSINELRSSDREMFKNIDEKSCKDCDTSKFNVSNFVKDLEKNLDNFDNIDKLETSPKPSNLNEELQNKRTENKIEKILDESNSDDVIPSKPKLKKKKPNRYQTYKDNIHYFLLEARIPIITILLFIILNNEELIILINQIPYINILPRQITSLILRGLILALVLYGLKKYNSK
jgi:hypothetical protein